MGTIKTLMDFAFRDFVVAGVESSGPREPDKAEIRDAGDDIDTQVETAKADIIQAQSDITSLQSSISDQWKAAVKFATVVPGTLASDFENGDTVDGYVLVTGDRGWINNQAAAEENGLFTIEASGAPTRATDADTEAELLGAAAFVENGTVNAGTSWANNDSAITIDVTAVTIVQRAAENSGVVAEVIAARGGEADLDARIDLIEVKTNQIDIGPTGEFSIEDERGFRVLAVTEDDGLVVPGGALQREEGAGIIMVDQRGFEVNLSFGAAISSGSAIRIWSGALTDVSFSVACDLLAGSVANIVVSTDSSLSTVIFKSVEKHPQQTPGESETYFPVKFDVVGLKPETIYYYGVQVDGLLAPDTVRQIKTMPLAGKATAFSFIFGSCSDKGPAAATLAPSLRAISNEVGPLFMVHLGDISYPNVSVSDVRVNRTQITRVRYRDGVEPELINRKLPMVYMPDDHDSTINDAHWDTVHADPNDHDSTIMGNTRISYGETFPHYPFAAGAEGKALSQVFTCGAVRFIMMDTRSQRRHTVGTPSILGNGTNPPFSFDQEQWVRDQLVQAGLDGIQQVFLFSSASWINVIHAGWEHHYSAARTALCDFIRDTAGLPQVMIFVGDSHYCAASSGPTTDASTGGGLTVPLFMSSPFRSVANGAPDDFDWNSVNNSYSGTDQYCRVDVSVAGVVTVKIYGAPYVADVATLLATYASDDDVPEVEFDSATYAAGQSSSVNVQVNKDFFGPLAGCTVDWATDEGSPQTGTASIGPNNGKVQIPIVTSDPATIIVTISAPSGCTIGSQNTTTITVT